MTAFEMMHILSDIALKYILYLGKKAFALVVIALTEAFLKLFQKLFLSLVKVLGHFHINSNILVASVGAVKTLYALSPYPENSARLSALGNGYLALAVDAGYLYLVAQNSLCVCDRHFRADIVAVSLKNRIGTNLNSNVKIAAGTAICAAVALTSYLKCLTVINARRDSNSNSLCYGNSARTVALRAGICDDLALSAAA